MDLQELIANLYDLDGLEKLSQEQRSKLEDALTDALSRLYATELLAASLG